MKKIAMILGVLILNQLAPFFADSSLEKIFEVVR